MDVQALSEVELEDANGTKRRMGDLWAEQPVVLVFLRHFGCLLCREHATDLRERYADITAQQGEVVAVGTGSRRYAAAFVEEEKVPFPVLVDDDGRAARAASVQKVHFFKLVLNPRSWAGTRRAHRAGHRVHRAGRRVTQLGATFVVGPGNQVRYEHLDAHSADHAPLDVVIGALHA
jgi:peroxiredoxin